MTDASPGHHKSQSRMDLHYPNISLLPKRSGGNGGREVAPVPDFFLRSLPVNPLVTPGKGMLWAPCPKEAAHFAQRNELNANHRLAEGFSY